MRSWGEVSVVVEENHIPSAVAGGLCGGKRGGSDGQVEQIISPEHACFFFYF